MTMRSLVAVVALAISALFVVEANAFCCGGGTTAFYPSTAYTAYSPVAYQSYYSGWYPGYYLDRFRAAWWGAPRTYAVAYPSTHYASYAPAYHASYQPAYASYAASYVPSGGCSTCTSCYSPCSTCTQQVTLRPVCATACSPCDCGLSTCSSCASSTVSHASYEQPGCATCGTSNTTVVVPNGTAVSPGVEQRAVPSNGDARPSVPEEQPSQPRTYQKPADDQQDIQPVPTGDTNGNGLDNMFDSENSTYFEPPKLFNPNDRTAQRSAAPVRNAVYEQPVEYREVSYKTRTITRQQAEQDAAGWTSISR